MAWAAGLIAVLLGAGTYIVYRSLSQPDARIGPLVSEDDRAGEAQVLASVGLTAPAGGAVLARPYDAPLSGRSYVVPGSWLPQGLRAIVAARQDVRADQLLLDLDILERAMTRAYGGWDSAAREGWDWAAWFAGWRDALARAGTRALPVDEAFAPMDALAAFRIDNHTNIPLMRFATSSPSQSAVLQRRPAGPCTEVEGSVSGVSRLRPDDRGQQPRSAVAPSADWTRLEPVAYVALPSRLGTLRRIRCGGEWIALGGGDVRSMSLVDLLRRGGRTSPVVVERLSEEVVYLRLPTFLRENYADIDALASDWPRPSGNDTAVIVDLRDNEGNVASYAHPVLHPWIDLARLPSAGDMRMTRAGSCLYHPFRWNFRRQQLRAGISLREDERRELQGMLDALALEGASGCPTRWETSGGSITYARHGLGRAPARRRVIVWINGGCASDCEYLVTQLASLPETIVVGTNTGGVMQFIQPGIGMLPHTRLAFRIALGESDAYGDGRSVDGHGLDVDVLIADDRNVAPRDLLRLLPLLVK